MSKIALTRQEQNLAKQLDIGGDLEDEMSRQASLYARWGFIMARAEAAASRAKEQVGITKADIARRYRLKMRDSRVTEPQIAEYVLTRKRYRAAVKARIEAEKNVAVLKVALKAFEQRKDMMTMIASGKKKEEVVEQWVERVVKRIINKRRGE
jgi:hypothetical protein